MDVIRLLSRKWPVGKSGGDEAGALTRSVWVASRVESDNTSELGTGRHINGGLLLKGSLDRKG